MRVRCRGRIRPALPRAYRPAVGFRRANTPRSNPPSLAPRTEGRAEAALNIRPGTNRLSSVHHQTPQPSTTNCLSRLLIFAFQLHLKWSTSHFAEDISFHLVLKATSSSPKAFSHSQHAAVAASSWHITKAASQSSRVVLVPTMSRGFSPWLSLRAP